MKDLENLPCQQHPCTMLGKNRSAHSYPPDRHEAKQIPGRRKNYFHVRNQLTVSTPPPEQTAPP